MAPVRVVEGRAAVLMQANVDTDVIVRIERLMEVRVNPAARGGLGRWAFEALRYDADGALRADCGLNDPAVAGAPILVAGPNFGCGSSREGAVWALMGLGLRCVVAESFGDIFYANCFQNGMLPVVLPGGEMARLAARAGAGGVVRVDLEGMTVTAGGVAVGFGMDAGRRRGLLLGLDEIGQTMLHAGAVTGWQEGDRVARGWAWAGLGAGVTRAVPGEEAS